MQESIADNTESNDSTNTTPFLTAATNKALPKYTGKQCDDINEFIYKLRVFLNHPSIDNCHLHHCTTETIAEQSKNLAALLSMCLSGNAISPFIDNPLYDHKGIEMLNHLMDLKHPVSKSSASTIYNAIYIHKQLYWMNPSMLLPRDLDSCTKHARVVAFPMTKDS